MLLVLLMAGDLTRTPSIRILLTSLAVAVSLSPWSRQAVIGLTCLVLQAVRVLARIGTR
jgi:hypothetical protein